MATYTTNYNLKKPALADKIRIADFNGNSDTIDGAMHDNAVLGAQLKSDIGIVENTNTATHNISAGQYVIWKGDLYTASDAISSGATLSNANLTAVSGGGLNALNGNIESAFAYGSTSEVDTGIIVSGSATMKRIRLYNTSASLGAGSFTKIGSIGANKWILNMRGLFRVSTDTNKAYTDGKYFQLRWDISTGDIYVEQSWSNSSITCNVSITIDYFDSN